MEKWDALVIGLRLRWRGPWPPTKRILWLTTECRRRVVLFMIIEHFRDSDMVPIYKRVRDAGRALPDGLQYIDSWVEPSFSRCFQLMECDDLRLIQQWVLHWRGFGVTMEIVPVVPSTETRDVVAPYLDES
jgi:hypothetical protein